MFSTEDDYESENSLYTNNWNLTFFYYKNDSN